MKQLSCCNWSKVAVALIGVVVFTTPILFFAAGPETEPPDTSNWLCTRIGGGIGPPGGEVRALTIAPVDPERLYAATASGHIYVTVDGAKSWKDCRVRLPREAILTRLAVNPRSPEIAFAAYWIPSGGGGLLRTRDGGENWERLLLPGIPALRALAISPSAPGTVYAGGPAGVWRSEDGGDTWINASGRTKPVREVESLAVDPRFPLRVYAGTWRQAYRSLDGGGIWAPIALGMDLDRDVFTIALSPHDPEKLFAGTCGFLYKSSNGGDLWSSRMAGIRMDQRRIHTIAADPIDAREVWVGTRGGIFRSLDDANSFTLLRGGVSVSSILTDPKGSRVFAATEEFGILTSGNGTSFVESNSGLEASRVPAFDSTAGDLRVLYSARTEKPDMQSIWASGDSGRTWRSMGRGMEFKKVRFLRGLENSELKTLVIAKDGRWWRLSQDAAEPLTAPPGQLAAVEVLRHPDVVLAATDKGLYFAAGGSIFGLGSPPTRSSTREGGGALEKASPGWRRAYAGALTALCIEGDRFVALGSEHVLRGEASTLLTGKPPEELRPEGLPKGIVAAALAPEPDSRVYAITHSQILVSADQGRTWTAALLPWPANDLCSVVVDPVRPYRVVALDSHGAVLEGVDHPPQWRVLLGDDPWLSMATDIRLSSASPGLAMISTLGHGIRVVSIE